MEQDEYNKKWHKWDDVIVYSPAPKHRRRIVLNCIKKYAVKDKKLHDLGCGNGYFLKLISQKFKGLLLSGSDISEEVIKQNQLKYSSVKFHSQDIGTDVDVSNCYDIITCCEVIEHLKDPEIAINNIAKLLKPFGIAIVTVPRGKVHSIDKMMGHCMHFKNADAFSKAFVVIDELKWGFPFFNLYKWAINLKPEYMNKQFGEKKYNTIQKIIANLIYSLFFLNLPIWGNQLILVLRSKRR